GPANAGSGSPSQRSPWTPLNAAIPNSRRVQFIGGCSLPAAAIGDERLDFVERGHRDRAAVAPGHNRAARVSQTRGSLERPVVEVPVKETAGERVASAERVQDIDAKWRHVDARTALAPDRCAR